MPLSLLLVCTRELSLCVAVCLCVPTERNLLATTLFCCSLTFFLLAFSSCSFLALLCVAARVLCLPLLAVLAIHLPYRITCCNCFFMFFFWGGAPLLFATRLGPLLRQPGHCCRAYTRLLLPSVRPRAALRVRRARRASKASKASKSLNTLARLPSLRPPRRPAASATFYTCEVSAVAQKKKTGSVHEPQR